MPARPKSSDTPAPPCAWIAQSITLSAMLGAATLIIAISLRATLLPTVSIMYAAFSTSSRACSMPMRDSAMRSRVTVCSAIGLPNATRRLTRRHMASSARSATPMTRMQWWIRPGPRRPCAISNPRPSPRIMLDTDTRTSSNSTSPCPCGASS
jgi:hypothetical protein